MPSSSRHCFQLRAAGRHHDVRRAAGGSACAVEVGVVEEVHVVDDRRTAPSPARPGASSRDRRRTRASGCTLVAGARRHVVAVGPDGRTRIVGEERPQELVAVVRPERIGARAHRVAHRVVPCGDGAAASRCAVRRSRLRRRWRRPDSWRRTAPGCARLARRRLRLAGSPPARTAGRRSASGRVRRSASRSASDPRAGRSAPRRRRCCAPRTGRRSP